MRKRVGLLRERKEGRDKENQEWLNRADKVALFQLFYLLLLLLSLFSLQVTAFQTQLTAMLASSTLNLGSLGTHLLNAPTHNPIKPLLLPPTKLFLKSSNPVCSSFLNSSSSIKTAVAAVDSSDPIAKEAEEGGRRKYHFLVANAKFMLDEEEHFNELLSERLRNYSERNKEQDFWLVIEPKFLDNFPNITKRLKRPSVALVSTNGTWITFMKLRLDRVLQESFEADSLEEALASNPVDLDFGKPAKWTAPYPKYEFGWWEPFLPPKTSAV